MKKYIPLAVSDLIVFALLNVFIAYMKSISRQAGLGAVVPGLAGMIVLILYFILYGVISYIKTKRIIIPHAILSVFIIIEFVVYIYVTGLWVDSAFDYIKLPIFALLFSLIPSLLTKLIMNLKKRNAEKTDI